MNSIFSVDQLGFPGVNFGIPDLSGHILRFREQGGNLLIVHIADNMQYIVILPHTCQWATLETRMVACAALPYASITHHRVGVLIR